MRGLTLLMVGIILAALTNLPVMDFSVAEAVYLPRRPMEGANGTSNSSVPQEESGENKVFVQWNGTIKAVGSDFGFPPTEPPKDTKENTQK